VASTASVWAQQSDDATSEPQTVAESGRAELRRIAEINGGPSIGIRMHWLLQDAKTYDVLEDAGYNYDASAGYNESAAKTKWR